MKTTLVDVFISFSLCLILTACIPSAGVPSADAPIGSVTSEVSPTVAQAAPAEAQSLPSQTATAGPIYLPAVTKNATPTPTSAPVAAAWTQVATGLADNDGIVSAGDGSGRLFVVMRAGSIRVIQNGQVAAAPFLDIHAKVNSSSSERGLIGLTFHPNYKSNGYFYVNYIDLSGNTVIARFKVSADANHADPASETDLLHVQQPYANHNGGSLAFGPDGFLYIGLGDGGGQGDPNGNAQNVNSLLGKILRIDVDHGSPYAIPAGNPFAAGGGRPEIWVYGLRNPWKFSFDAGSGDLFIGDVGQDLYEEIDYLAAGSPGGNNFGWNYREGLHPYKGTPPANLVFTDPVFEYDHGQGCAVIGGPVYRGSALAGWQGTYLFGDYCSGKIWGLRNVGGKWQGSLLFTTAYSITAFGADEQGEIYLTDQKGAVEKLAVK
jgi:glucose/arabinose dehydrogenase